ncbi:natural killer cells antigen CD94-like isoform X2 [Ochotona curzoniae]|uniref:natural killer cells antigen CD94-like isoform X2 n=1 Tax=Ochotona curzoniae TaxID=130825 RepID=UPI001B34CD80|nr:natural killer cells antigen CD94-like isoform X2 [Ochotona curzoniae]
MDKHLLASRKVLWRFVSGTLGIICLLLMTTLGFVLKNVFSKPSNQSTFLPEVTIEFQEGSDCCSCPDKWIGYQCNCYFFSDETKTWRESGRLCGIQNSSLLKLQSEDELRFMSSNRDFYWIGLSYWEEYGAWLWEDGSAIFQDLFQMFKNLTPKNCVVYSPTKLVVSENCEKSNLYICKKQLTQVLPETATASNMDL